MTSENNPKTLLSDQQRTALWLIACGHTHEEAATTMGVAAGTLKAHLDRGARKLGAHGSARAAHAVHQAYRLGIFSLADTDMQAPADGSLAVVTYRRDDTPELERAWLRQDRPGAAPDGQWYPVGLSGTAATREQRGAYSWPEVLGLDDPPEERSKVQVQIYQWVGSR